MSQEYTPEERLAGDAMRRAHALCPTDMPHLERMRWMGKYVYDQLAATLRQAARVDEATIREVISDLREWGEAGDEQLLVRANRLEAALSAQPAERQGEDVGRALLRVMLDRGCDQKAQMHVCTLLGLVTNPENMHPRDVAEAVAYFTHPAAPVGVPDGMVLVPREPTQEMLDACRSETWVGGHYATMAYKAMLAAAPSAPQGVE